MKEMAVGGGETGGWPDPQTQALLRALARDAERLRLLREGGPDWLRLRERAFRFMVLQPLRSAWRRCLRRLDRRAAGRSSSPACRAQPGERSGSAVPSATR